MGSYSSDVGLFGLSSLNEPDDFLKLSRAAIERVNGLRSQIHASSSDSVSSAEQTLLALDSVSNEVCSVIDAAELCRHVHVDPQWRASAEASFAQLSTFIHTLNGDTKMYRKLACIVEDGTLMAALDTEESRLFAADLKREFESEGIHLDESKREAVARIQGEVVGWETAVMQNITAPWGSGPASSQVQFTMGPLPEIEMQGLRAYLANFTSQPTDETLSNCPADPRIGASLLARIPKSLIRRQVWHGTRGAPEANAAAIGGLVRSRHDLASSLGYPSYAHKILQNRVLESPEQVNAFLRTTADKVRPLAEEQMHNLTALKRRIINSGSGSDGKFDETVMPWDVAYLSNVYRTSFAARAKGSSSDALSQVARHLPLSACLDGLEDLLNTMFGIVLRRRDLKPGEAWAGPSTGILSYSIETSNGGPLGHVYLDLFSRRDKIPASAHFTIRCGCTNASSWQGQEEGQRHQLPIVALVFNFQPRVGSSASTSLDNVFLTLSELENFFHEWGHALHSLLSRTTYQHLSGTRGPLDAVEVPSHMMEEFVRDAQVLSEFGQNMPAGILEEALEQHQSLAAVETQTQLLYSVADQVLFGVEAAEMVHTHARNEDLFGAMEAAVAQAQTSFTSLPLDDRGAPLLQLASHGHLTNYGGSYYSYLFARMYAAQIYDRHLADASARQTGGRAVWEGLLRHGASRNAAGMLEEVGGKFCPDLYLSRLG